MTFRSKFDSVVRSMLWLGENTSSHLDIALSYLMYILVQVCLTLGVADEYD